jgi:hypothetical protein
VIHAGCCFRDAVKLSGCRPKQRCRLEPFIRNAISRDKSVHEPIVRRSAHPRRLVGVLVIGRVAAKPHRQQLEITVIYGVAGPVKRRASG